MLLNKINIRLEIKEILLQIRIMIGKLPRGRRSVPKEQVYSYQSLLIFKTNVTTIYFLNSKNKAMAYKVRVTVFNATFNNISVISWWSVILSQKNRSIRRKPPTCRKALTNFITKCCNEYTSHE